MKHPERLDDYLEHIVQAIDRATRYVADIENAAALQANEQTQDAVVRNIEIIGEAANRVLTIAPAFLTSHPEIPWVEMRGMRNKMIHEYFDVDWDIVWTTVQHDLPLLKQQITGYLAGRRRIQAQEDGTENNATIQPADGNPPGA